MRMRMRMKVKVSVKKDTERMRRDQIEYKDEKTVRAANEGQNEEGRRESDAQHGRSEQPR